MGHYKSNVRDIEFNLFEVFGTDADAAARGPFAELDEDTARGIARRGRQAGRGPAGRVLRRRRPQPAGVRPGDQLGDAARVVQEVLPDAARRRVVAPGDAARARRPARPRARSCWAVAEQVLGANPALHMYMARRAVRRHPLRATATPTQKQIAQLHDRPRLGRHHGAHRARRRLRRRRRPHQGDRAARRHAGTSRASSASSPRPSTT